MALPRGAALGPYEVLAPIGAGGMAEVYEALDTRLGRRVAVKVLPADLVVAGDQAAALDWLEKAVPRGYFNYPYLRSHDVFLASLRGHPRYERVVSEIQSEWEAFRA